MQMFSGCRCADSSIGFQMRSITVHRWDRQSLQTIASAETESLEKGRLPTTDRITVALKLAASNLRTSQSYLGAQFRRFRSRLDTPVAIKAMAAKLARLVYRILRYGTKYFDGGTQFYEVQQRAGDISVSSIGSDRLNIQLREFLENLSGLGSPNDTL
jgi:hypothetical protein